MPRYIVKIKDCYLEWSTVIDAPVTDGMSLDDFKEYYKAKICMISQTQPDAKLPLAGASSTILLIKKMLSCVGSEGNRRRCARFALDGAGAIADVKISF